MVHLNYNTKEVKSQEQSNNKLINLYRNHAKAATKRTENLAQAYFNLYQETESTYYLRRYEAVKNCHDYALFRKYFDPNDTTEIKKLNRCKNPLCSFCNWVEAKKRYTILAGAMEQLKADGIKTIHCVITIPNCIAADLQNQINTLHKIITKTLRHFKIEGYYRATEITYNKKENTYHPHAHLLITDYINIFDLTAYTAAEYKRINPEYDKDYTICYITKCNYVKELCKYITKPTDYNIPQLQEMIQKGSIYNVRKVACGGIIKQAYKETDKLIKTLTAGRRTELEIYGFIDELISLG